MQNWRMPPRDRQHRPLAIDASHWRQDGRPKVRYATKGDAAIAADERSKDAGAPLGIYECAFCHGWHMGRRGSRNGRFER